MSTEFLVTTLVIVATHPKLTIFFFAFLPQFVNADAPDAAPRMLELSGIFTAVTFAVFAAYGAFAAAVRKHVIARPTVTTWMRRFFGGALLALAGRLALTER